MNKHPVSGISGIGETPYSRQAQESQLKLQAIAIRNALADAGLKAGDIDGLINCSSTEVGNDDVIGAFGMERIALSMQPGLGGMGPVAAIDLATAAIHAGRCRHVLVSVARKSSSGVRVAGRMQSAPQFRLMREYEMPLGLQVPAQVMAMLARHHMETFGTRAEHFGTLAVATRGHALRNGNAMMTRPIGLDDYLASPMISDPLRKLDCAVESDGGCAFIVSAAPSLADRPEPAVYVLSCAQAFIDSPGTISQRKDLTRFAISRVSKAAFDAAGVRPGDIDVAEIYDAFTYMALCQIEDLGFCGKGEGGPFIASGATAPDGALPMNTHGGLLSQAHMMGMNHVVELVRQLRGTAGQAQVRNAQVGVVTGCGDFGNGALAILQAQGAQR